MPLTLPQIIVNPGEKLLLKDVSWQQLEDILDELGHERSSKIAYDNGVLEIMTPLPEHERNKEHISDFVKILLEELDIEFVPLGSTTFKNELMKQGIEPDNCFYIKHEGLVRDKDRLDLAVDPPPDLALEVDVTSRTHKNIYQSLSVPELWRFNKGKLEVNILENNAYIEVEFSSIFPNIPVKEIIPQYLNSCKIDGRNTTMKAFRNYVRKHLGNRE